MNISEYFPDYQAIGYAKKSYGVEGFVRVFVEDQFKNSLQDAEHCFFLLKGCLVPYFIQKMDEGIIKFESCNSPEDTKTIVSRTIYLHDSQLIDVFEEPSNGFEIVVGFDLINSDTEEIVGKVNSIETYPEQEIAIVADGEREYMIPLNIHNVKGINQEEQLIFVEIPEGLLDL